MNPLANSARPAVSDTNTGLTDALEVGDANETSDDSSESASSEQPAPHMQQADEDVMQIDSDDDDGSRSGLKRKWAETQVAAIMAGGDESPGSSEPDVKRRRTSTSGGSDDDTSQSLGQIADQRASADKVRSSSTASPVLTIWLDAVRDTDFIQLLTRHDGKPSGQARGRSIELCLPPAPSLEFRVAYLCLQLQRLRKEMEFPGKENFPAHAASEFDKLLKEASLADEAALLRQLLNTGYPAPPELIDPLLVAATAAEAHHAAEVLRDAIHTPSGARAAEDLADSVMFPVEPQANATALPLPGWREQVKANFDSNDIFDLLKCFASEGDQERGLGMLFGPQDSRPGGKFFLKKISCSDRTQRDLLERCGAVYVGFKEENVWYYLCAGDFDHELLKAGLIGLQADENDDSEITALKFAIQWSDPDIVRSLLNNGAQPRLTDSGQSVLHYAARSPNVAILDMLIAALSERLAPGASLADDLNLLDDHGKTPLYEATRKGYFKICERLLDKGALSMPVAAGGGGNPPLNPLITAAKHGDAALCTLLVMHGGDVNDPDARTGLTPLQMTAKGGHLHACKALLGLGADIRAATESGKTALSIAVNYGKLEMVRYLLEHGASPNEPANQEPVLLLASRLPPRQNSAELLALLLDHGAQLNQRNNHGKRSLSAACRFGPAQSVELLLSRGADPNLIEDTDDDPLIVAMQDISKVKLLIRYGVNLHAGGRGLRVLNMAIDSGNLDVVSLLLEKGVTTNPLAIGLHRSHNPLVMLAKKVMRATRAGQLDHSTLPILELLLQRDTPVHDTDVDGFDLLMAATFYLYLPCIVSLLRHGARIGQINTGGENALQIAIKQCETFRATKDAEPAAGVLTTLLAQVCQQDNADELINDAIFVAKDPVVRDIVRFSSIWESVKMDQIQDWISENLSDFCIDRLRDHLAIDPKLASRETLLHNMSVWGFTQPVVKQMMTFIDAYPNIQAALSGNMPSTSRTSIAFSALSGWIASLEKLLVRPADDWRPYPDFRYGAKIESVLTEITRRSLVVLVDKALAAGEALVADAYAELFESCLAQTPQPWVIDGQLVPMQLVRGSLAHKLIERGIYASMAERIEYAWMTAWTDTASMATGSASTTVVDLQGFDPDSVGGELPDFDTWLPLAPLPVEPTPLSQSAFADSPIGDKLMRAFRRALHAITNSTSSNILKLPDAEQLPQEEAAAAQAVYETLMMRQLHMLAQFIDPGMFAREAQEYEQRVQRLAASGAATS